MCVCALKHEHTKHTAHERPRAARDTPAPAAAQHCQPALTAARCPPTIQMQNLSPTPGPGPPSTQFTHQPAAPRLAARMLAPPCGCPWGSPRRLPHPRPPAPPAGGLLRHQAAAHMSHRSVRTLSHEVTSPHTHSHQVTNPHPCANSPHSQSVRVKVGTQAGGRWCVEIRRAHAMPVTRGLIRPLANPECKSKSFG